MLPRQKLLAVLIGVGLIILVFDLVRRRKLREEYSWLWMLLGTAILLVSIWDGFLVRIGNFIGIIDPTSALFFLGGFFIVLICLHFCIKISTLTNQIKELVQKSAISGSSEDDAQGIFGRIENGAKNR